MPRFLIPIFFAFSLCAKADDDLWKDNMLTPAQPFPGRVLAVESGWGGYRLFIESLGDGEKKYCIAQVWPGGLPRLIYNKIPKGDLPQPSDSTVFLNPSIEIDRFSWSMGPWKIGRIFEDEDCLKKAIALAADERKRRAEEGAAQPTTAPESEPEGDSEPHPE